MLVNATAMLQSAEKGHYGIGAFKIGRAHV